MSTDSYPSRKLTPDDWRLLCEIARDSILWACQNQGQKMAASKLTENMQSTSPLLQENGACFVTLNQSDQLRGCIGTLESHQALWRDVLNNAHKAAFADPRFNSLNMEEITNTQMSLSVLNPPLPFPISSERELLSELQAGQDGLVLRYRHHRATFLPAVWQNLPDKKQFVIQLKRKAGLADNFWDSAIRFERYTVQEHDCGRLSECSHSI